MATRAELLVQAAQASKDRGLARVLTGLAIRGCGPAMSRQLAERFQSADRLLTFAWAYCWLRERGWSFREAWGGAKAYAWCCWPSQTEAELQGSCEPR